MDRDGISREKNEPSVRIAVGLLLRECREQRSLAERGGHGPVAVDAEVEPVRVIGGRSTEAHLRSRLEFAEVRGVIGICEGDGDVVEILDAGQHWCAVRGGVDGGVQGA